MDEMYVKLNGEMVYLWRAVDHEGEMLESYVTRSRDKAAAVRFMKKTLRWAARQQPGGELTPAVSTTGAGDAEVSADKDAAEIRLRPRQRPQLL